MKNSIYYSVIIPGHNESGSIIELITKVKDELKKTEKPFEIIFVNDNSTDKSFEILKKLKTKIKELVIINRTSNPGVGNAKKEGFSIAKGEILITMDGDLSHNPEEILSLINALGNSDIVCGSRYLNSQKEHEMSLLRKIISFTFNFIIGFLIALPVKDFTSGFRVIRRKVIDSIELKSKGFGIYIEIPIKAHLKNFKIKEAPIHYRLSKSESNLSYLKQGKEYFIVSMYGLFHSKFTKFLIVGVSGTFVNTGLLYFLTEFAGLYYLISSGIAIEISILSNFFLNEKFTFSERRKGRILKRIVKYNGALLISGSFVFILLYTFTELMNIYYLFSNIVAIIIIFVINYLFSQKFVWVYDSGNN